MSLIQLQMFPRSECSLFSSSFFQIVRSLQANSLDVGNSKNTEQPLVSRRRRWRLGQWENRTPAMSPLSQLSLAPWAWPACSEDRALSSDVLGDFQAQLSQSRVGHVTVPLAVLRDGTVQNMLRYHHIRILMCCMFMRGKKKELRSRRAVDSNHGEASEQQTAIVIPKLLHMSDSVLSVVSESKARKSLLRAYIYTRSMVNAKG